MTSSNPSSAREPVVSSRRMGRRLLAGSGSASLTAFRIDPGEGQLVLHAMDTTGRIFVASCPSSALARTSAGVPISVRLDITLDAAEPGMHLTAASAHLLGVLTWLEGEERNLALAGAHSAACHCAVAGADPLDGIIELSRAPGGRLGVVLAERVVVHDALGVHGHSMSEVLDPVGSEPAAPLWSSLDELAAQEAVKSLGTTVLTWLCDGVVDGSVPGRLCSVRPLNGACAELAGRVLCVDACPQDVTLMRLTGPEALTVRVDLPRTAPTAREMLDELDRLAWDSAAARP